MQCTARAPGPVAALLFVNEEAPLAWSTTISSLLHNRVPVFVVGDPASSTLRHHSVDVIEASPAGALDGLVRDGWGAVLAVTSPVRLPEDALSSALAALDDDMRIATVSFLSNRAGRFTFPHRNSPEDSVTAGESESSLTHSLRLLDAGQRLVPVAAPDGSAIVLSTTALQVTGGLDPSAPDVGTAVVDVGLRAVHRGFRQVLDATTFIATLPTSRRLPEPHTDPQTRAWLGRRHDFYPVLVDEERDAFDTPLSDALTARAAAILGLRILVDASCLGPDEMGTQVAVLAQINALAAHPGVARLEVGTRGGKVPDYARRTLLQARVRVVDVGEMDFPRASHADILHRPYQPDALVPGARWRVLSHRVVVTIQDLIAYDNGYYHRSKYNWMLYRHAMKEVSRLADTLVVISRDTERAVRDARLPIGGERIHVIENGTDHLEWTAPESPSPPIEFLESAAVADPFILVLGAAYAHKNRDLAVKTWHELLDRGRHVRLVLAGAMISVGSSREDEAVLAAQGPAPITLADVTTRERDWLLTHADVVLYPTSAEGFGLVPFEAASLGTPSVFVGFGPLAEVLPDVPVRARDWSPTALADAVEELFDDPNLARRQVSAVLAAARELTWERFANRLVDTYLRTLAAPTHR